jgi:hypothetical protein
VRRICEHLRRRLPFHISEQEREVIRLLYAIAYIERKPATDTKRGRPGRWTRQQLTQAASILRSILDRETQGRLSVKSFTSQYVQILHFPADILEPLEAGQINLQEGINLSRISPARIGCSPREAQKLRREILEAHLSVQGSQSGLRSRVKQILGEVKEEEITTRDMAEAVGVIDELLEVDPGDSRHLFWEQMKEIFFSMREIRPDDLDDELLDEFTAAMDQICSVLYKIKRRRNGRQQQSFQHTPKIVI